ncbi:Hexosyltransferase [Fasciola hepatica]|uniref:Hexosyltransferase n=1 Tax=Fasciola hepatica TaxID=6192 RepID=A0A4E0S1X7_FASHE|nr:Hexosyltransferase [Fasciola hepatica]
MAQFSRIRAPRSMCNSQGNGLRPMQNQSTIDILFVVKSRIKSFDQRSAIRSTWGNASCALSVGALTQTLFALGTTAVPEPLLDFLLQREQDEHDDLLQFDFVDEYYNNTYKLMSSLKYISRYCPNARFVMIVDEDFLVNVKNVIRTIRSVTNLEYQTYVSGHVYDHMKPMRTLWGKWYISYLSYPFSTFPPYATGGSIIFSMPVVRLLVVGMPFVKYLWIDDVYIGFVLLKYGISPRHLNGIYLKRTTSPSELRNAISSHKFSNAQLMNAGWTVLKDIGVCRNDSVLRTTLNT